MRASWLEYFAETRGVLKTAEHQQTIVRVLDVEIGGNAARENEAGPKHREKPGRDRAARDRTHHVEPFEQSGFVLGCSQVFLQGS